MKLTLAFQVYNKEEYIESVMDSWISNLSGQNEYEVIIVFDDCKDRSIEIVNRYLKAKKFKYMFLFADDRYEIFCNNLALKYASGDYVVFIQDDNWIYDEDWDLLLVEALRRVDNVGAVGLLAGVQMLPEQNKLRYQRIEINRAHKGASFSMYDLPQYQLGVWQVDAICRPFCISRELLLSYGGMDEAFSPTCGDDLDLGIKLLKDGKTNLYIPFDVVNPGQGKETMRADFYRENYERAFSLNYLHHGTFLAERTGNHTKVLIPLIMDKNSGLKFVESADAKAQAANISTILSTTKELPGETWSKRVRFLNRNQYAIWFGDRCTYKCSYCCNRGDPRAPYSAVENSPQAVVDLFKKLHPGVITLSGGEPTLWEDLPDIMDALPQHYWALLTNLSRLPQWVGHPNIKIIIPAFHSEFADEQRFTDRLFQLKQMHKRVHVKLMVKSNHEYEHIDRWERWNDMGIPTSLTSISYSKYQKQFILDVIEKYRTSCVYNARFFQIEKKFKGRYCLAGTNQAFQVNPDGLIQRCSSIGDKLGSMFFPEFDKGTFCNNSCACEWHAWGAMALANDNETWNHYVETGIWKTPSVEQLRQFIVDMEWDLSGATVQDSNESLFDRNICQKRNPKTVDIYPRKGVKSSQLNSTTSGTITLFSMPKAFTNTFATIQENALKSWMKLRPCPEIILFGNDEGVAEFAQKYNLKHIPNVQRNEFGTPLLNDLFLKAQTTAAGEICVYVNADIILMNDFVEAVDKVGTEFDQFLMIGRRWDIDITESVEFDKEKWQEHLRMQVKMVGSLHLDRGIDYFAFRKGLWRQIPPFGIGRTAWDNWLVYAPLSEGKDVVDATEAVTVVHQNHNFSHIRGGKETPRFQLEAQQNREIAGPVVLMGVGAASDATWRLTKDGLVRNKPEGYNTHLKELCSKLLEKGWDKKYNLYKKYFHSAQYLKQIKKPCISIVVISWRFHPDTVKNFEALAQQRDDNFELIFVNNGATNDEFEDLMPFIDTYIKLNHNTGAYLARNIGALFAKAPILLFLDDDGIAETDIVRAYLRNFEKYDVIAVRGSVWPKERGAGPYSAHRYYGSKPFPYFSCQEGNTAYKASVFYQVSGWDDEIRFGHGGIDLSRRLMEIEPDMRKQMYSPEPVIHHDPVKDKKILEEKARKQKISAKRLERKHPDFYVLQRRFNEYLQREDLLIHKDAYQGSYTNMKGPDEHIYPFRDIARHNLALQRAQLDTKKLTTSLKNSKDVSAATDVNNQILAEESFRKGFRYLRNGDASEAIKYLEKAAKNCMTLPNLHYALAAAYAELGDIFSAQKACEMELNLQPEHSGARKFLERIQKALTFLAPAADSKPKVSIVISCYNCEKFLSDCLDSIQNQTMNDWELFLLDDGSTDDTRSIIKKYAQIDERIRPYYFRDNRGPYVRRNFAIERANSDFIVIQDADDIMYPPKLEILYNAIAKDERLEVVGSFYRMCLEQSKGLEYADKIELPITHDEIMQQYSLERYVCWHGSAIIRKSMFEQIGLYDEHPYGSDKFWLAKAAEYARCSNEVRFKNVPEYLTLKREHLSSQQGLLPTLDPRSRRARFQTYWEYKLLKIREKLNNNPDVDIKAELRKCRCDDYIKRYGYLFEQWESQQLDDNILWWFISRGVGNFNESKYVQCVIILDSVEKILNNVTKRFKNYDLLRAMAYFAINMKQQCLRYLNREIENHNNTAARKFISDYFENQLNTSVRDWCRQNSKFYNLQMVDIERKSGAQQENSAFSERHGSEQREHEKVSRSPYRAQAGVEPLVSVIIPAYNAVDYIKEAIESVLIQNYRNFELLIINDGSTDNTEEVVLGFKDERIRYFRQENRGLAATHNVGIKQSRGEFTIKLDSDDMMMPDFIAKHLQEFEKHPDADLVYCDDCLIDENSKPIRVIERPEYTDRKTLIRDLFRCGFPVVPFRTCIRRSVFDKIGFFDENLRMAEDYDMMRRFVKMGLKIQHLPAALYLRRMTSDSLSRNFTAQNAKFHFDVVRRFTNTFTCDELFPDVAWDEIAPQMRQLHAKCLAAGTYLAIGQDYVKTNATEYSRTAFDQACSELNDCVKMDPENQDLRQLLQKSKLIRARYTEALQQVVSK